MKHKKIFWLLIILLIIVLVLFALDQVGAFQAIRQNQKLVDFFANLENQIPEQNKDNPWQGKDNAKLTIFYYSDFYCPYCKDMESILNDALKKYSNQLKVVWKDFPVHENSMTAAIAGRCANEQGKFWPYHDLLFDNQAKLNNSYLAEAAAKVNMDINKWQRCLLDPATQKLVDADFNEGFLIKVDSTPYFFIGNARVSGYLDANKFNQLIDEQLANKL